MIKIIIAVATLGIYIYWQYMEKKSGVERHASGHTKGRQRIIRGLMPTLGGLIIAQLLGWQILSIKAPTIFNNILLVSGLFVYGFGFTLSVWAREGLGNNWAHAADYQIRPGQLFVQKGPYAYVRHPIYTGLLLLFMGAELVIASWLVSLVVPLVWLVYWQARKEEKLLSREFGPSYREYQGRTGMFLPRMKT